MTRRLDLLILKILRARGVRRAKLASFILEESVRQTDHCTLWLIITKF